MKNRTNKYVLIILLVLSLINFSTKLLDYSRDIGGVIGASIILLVIGFPFLISFILSLVSVIYSFRPIAKNIQKSIFTSSSSLVISFALTTFASYGEPTKGLPLLLPHLLASLLIFCYSLIVKKNNTKNSQPS